ncbi:MAG: dipeptidase [Alicyclobacillus sp.]|nr:dipeptidase [Alicyclobacillus sp.]
MTAKYDTYLAEHRDEHLAQLQAFLRYQSVSALSEHKPDVLACAEFLADHARTIGFEHVALLPTAGNPVVYGDWLHAPGKPTVLIYGHYDVQPVDPLPLWQSQPFEPAIRDGRIYARGATDDKGPVFMLLKSFEAILRTDGALPVNVKLCIEGEEEVGSRNLGAFLEANAEQFACDVLVISDTPILGPNRPAVCYGLRGLTGLQLDVKGAKGDLHSGLYGGGVQNAIHALVQILASLRDPETNCIAVPGFYDDVIPLTDAERAEYAKLGFDEEALKRELGVTALPGEEGYSYLERTWARPTLEINGIYGGFQGEGGKTVIPCEAHAKITCRLVPNQDPNRVLDAIIAHIERNTPPGVTVSYERRASGKAYVTPLDHPVIRLAAEAYEHAYGVPAAFIRMGGSIGVVELFDRLLHAPIVMMGFGLPDENFHAPNEFFTLANFDKGLRALTHYWTRLPEVWEK